MKSLQVTEFGKPLEWNELPTPSPKGKEVLLKVVSSGVCHSDLHLWEGYYELGEGKRMYVKDRGVTLPLTLGHEVVGKVTEAGDEVSGVKKGDVRLVYPWVGCGECKYCKAERSNVCLKPRSLGIYQDGGYSDYIKVPDEKFLVDIGDLPSEKACSYACAGLTAYGALQKALPIEKDEHILLIGAGGLGLIALQLIGELTQAKVIVLDIDNRKLEAAKNFGDFVLINSKDKDPKQEIMDITGGIGVERTVDFVNTTQTAQLAFSALAKNGMHIMVGLFGGELTVPTPALPLKNLTIRGSYTGSLQELKDLIGLLNERKPKSIPVKKYPIDNAMDIILDIKKGNITGRAVLELPTNQS